MTDTSKDYINRVIAAAPFADNDAGIPQMCELIVALTAERDALLAQKAATLSCGREHFEAFCAMRNDLAEMFGPVADMPSDEASLKYGPECTREYQSVVEAMSRVKAAMPAPRVKTLEWGRASCGNGFIAVTPVGQYAVFDDESPRWAFSSRGGYKYHYVANLTEAKAAAQADYERRIMSALDLTHD